MRLRAKRASAQNHPNYYKKCRAEHVKISFFKEKIYVSASEQSERAWKLFALSTQTPISFNV